MEIVRAHINRSKLQNANSGRLYVNRSVMILKRTLHQQEPSSRYRHTMLLIEDNRVRDS